MSDRLPPVSPRYVLDVLDREFLELQESIDEHKSLDEYLKSNRWNEYIDRMREQQRHLILAKRKLIEVEKH